MKRIFYILFVFILINIPLFANAASTENAQPGAKKLSAYENFDPVYFAIKYPDITVTIGTNPNDLYDYYCRYGKKEGRYRNRVEDPTTVEDLPYQTYIDVDIENQTVIYYNHGINVIECECISGNESEGDDTPKGTFRIRDKVEGKRLTGPTWNVWVDYWMPFYSNCGFHDAVWRKPSMFGGDTYKTNGSHGCVNMPVDTMEEFFSIVDVGTTVYIH